jgi:hypothetical protein
MSFIFSKTFVQNIFHSNRYVATHARDMHKCSYRSSYKEIFEVSDLNEKLRNSSVICKVTNLQIQSSNFTKIQTMFLMLLHA